LVSRIWNISSGIGPYFHWLEDSANITPTPEENDQYSAAPSTLFEIQAASQSTFIMNNYTSLEISGIDKNTQQLRHKIIREPKTFKRLTGPLFRPKTNHICHQKPNPSRETVPSTGNPQKL
jgi:hypothetical protein